MHPESHSSAIKQTESKTKPAGKPESCLHERRLSRRFLFYLREQRDRKKREAIFEVGLIGKGGNKTGAKKARSDFRGRFNRKKRGSETRPKKARSDFRGLFKECGIQKSQSAIWHTYDPFDVI